MSEISTPATQPAPVEPKPEPKAAKPEKRAKAEKKHENFWDSIPNPISLDDKRLVMPQKEGDPFWEYKMDIPVPEGVIVSLAQNGWMDNGPLMVKPMGGKLYITQGRTKFRAVPEANKRRSRNKLPPITKAKWVVDTRDALTAKLFGHQFNYGVTKIDPITTAKELHDLFGQPILDANNEPTGDLLEESELAKRFSMSVKEVQEHLALLRLPAKVQKLVAEERMTVSAALALVHLDEGKVEAAAAKIVETAESVGRVTKAAAQKAAGKTSGTDRMSPKDVKQLIKELKAADVKGKHGGQVRRAAILALETYLDADKADDFWDALTKLGAE